MSKRTRGRFVRIPAEEKHTKEADHFKSEPAPYINPMYEDEKFLASRKVGEYHYSIYVKPAQPEVRDAIIFLNIATRDRERLYFEINAKAHAREFMKIATRRLLEYVDDNIGEFRLFFTKSRYVYPMTGVIMQQHLWRENFPLRLLLDLIDNYDDEKLYTMLLVHLHTKGTMHEVFLKKMLVDRKLLIMYLEGASYEKSVKKDLIKLYDNTSVGNKRKPSLKKKLSKFIQNYYQKYQEVFGFVQKFVEKDIEKIKKEIRKTGGLAKVTDNFIFRTMLMRYQKEKAVCIELLPFCRGNVEYFSTDKTIIICVGNGAISMPGAITDTSRVGEKLKLLSDEHLYKIMRSIFAKPTTLTQLSSEFGLTPNATYRVLAKLVEERYIIKEENQTYHANKEFFDNIIKLIERFGGDE